MTEGVSEPFVLVSSKEQPRAVQPSDSSAFSGESQNKYDLTLVTSTCDLCAKRSSHCWAAGPFCSWCVSGGQVWVVYITFLGKGMDPERLKLGKLR